MRPEGGRAGSRVLLPAGRNLRSENGSERFKGSRTKVSARGVSSTGNGSLHGGTSWQLQVEPSNLGLRELRGKVEPPGSLTVLPQSTEGPAWSQADALVVRWSALTHIPRYTVGISKPGVQPIKVLLQSSCPRKTPCPPQCINPHGSVLCSGIYTCTSP